MRIDASFFRLAALIIPLLGWAGPARSGAGIGEEKAGCFWPHARMELQTPVPGQRPTLAEVKRALESLPAEVQRYFYKDSTGHAFDSDRFGYATRLEKSYERPQPLYNLTVPAEGGAALYQDDIYAESYFRLARLSSFPKAPSTARLAKEEPWLEWKAKPEGYVLRHGGMQARILARYLDHGKLRIYRGMGGEELKALRKLQNGGPEDFQNFLKGWKDALFFTPDPTVARLWSHGFVIELQISAADLDKLYAGIESNAQGGAIEVAIPDPDVLRRALGSLRVDPTP